MQNHLSRSDQCEYIFPDYQNSHVGFFLNIWETPEIIELFYNQIMIIFIFPDLFWEPWNDQLTHSL